MAFLAPVLAAGGGTAAAGTAAGLGTAAAGSAAAGTAAGLGAGTAAGLGAGAAGSAAAGTAAAAAPTLTSMTSSIPATASSAGTAAGGGMFSGMGNMLNKLGGGGGDVLKSIVNPLISSNGGDLLKSIMTPLMGSSNAPSAPGAGNTAQTPDLSSSLLKQFTQNQVNAPHFQAPSLAQVKSGQEQQMSFPQGSWQTPQQQDANNQQQEQQEATAANNKSLIGAIAKAVRPQGGV